MARNWYEANVRNNIVYETKSSSILNNDNNEVKNVDLNLRKNATLWQFYLYISIAIICYYLYNMHVTLSKRASLNLKYINWYKVFINITLLLDS